ncbi:MAG: hypothetical protein LBR77_08810 [Lachnospiraceae bacterium]|jgi:hypothetical protein|nr:hypothetical protein [Lachnospiraceae bacterium]
MANANQERFCAGIAGGIETLEWMVLSETVAHFRGESALELLTGLYTEVYQWRVESKDAVPLGALATAYAAVQTKVLAKLKDQGLKADFAAAIATATDFLNYANYIKAHPDQISSPHSLTCNERFRKDLLKALISIFAALAGYACSEETTLYNNVLDLLYHSKVGKSFDNLLGVEGFKSLGAVYDEYKTAF